MKPHISGVTLGVKDVNRSKQFYGSGLGWPIQYEQGDWVSFSINNGSCVFGLLPWKALADDVGAMVGADGFGGISLSYLVSSEARVKEVLDEAQRAGGTIVKPAQQAQWGGYFGYFSDPDGYPWKVALGAHQPSAAE